MSFYDIFNVLANDYKFSKGEAYTICERAFRGGGYTKDHIYFTGYEQVKHLWETSPESFELLYMGKVGIAHLPICQRLYKNGKGILYPPRHLPVFFKDLETTVRLRMPQPSEDDDSADW